MQEVALNLTAEEAAFVVAVLNNLPTQSNAWPLVQKLKGQLESQVPQAPAEPAAPGK